MSILICSFTGCKEKEEKIKDYTQPDPINFNMTDDELREYNGKVVQITGYLAITANQDENVSFLTHTPLAITPPTEIDGTTLKNTFAIYTNNGTFYTCAPVTVTGILTFGTFSDGYGTYQSTYKIEKPQIKATAKTNLDEKYHSFGRFRK